MSRIAFALIDLACGHTWREAGSASTWQKRLASSQTAYCAACHRVQPVRAVRDDDA